MIAALRTVFMYRPNERWYTLKARYGVALAFVVGYQLVGTDVHLRWPL